MTFFNMGGYGGYIGSAFGFVLGGMLYLLVLSFYRAQQVKRALVGKEQSK